MESAKARKGFTPPGNAKYRYRNGSPVDMSPGYHPHVSTRYVNWGVEVEPAIANRDLPELYLDRSECCGCTACAAVCPKDAVSMDSDEEGFAYPVVNAALCIRCGRCTDACAFKTALVERWGPNVADR